jgi:hypothetical protein
VALWEPREPKGLKVRRDISGNRAMSASKAMTGSKGHRDITGSRAMSASRAISGSRGLLAGHRAIKGPLVPKEPLDSKACRVSGGSKVFREFRGVTGFKASRGWMGIKGSRGRAFKAHKVR